MTTTTTTATTHPVQAALDQLDALGGPDAIAAHLLSGGHQGRVCGGSDCPVALYVCAVADVPWFTLTSETWRAMLADGGGPVPEHVGRFVERFDLDCYPSLIGTPA